MLFSMIDKMIVFDGSAHEQNKNSLNECLLTGPNLNPELLDVLIRFKQYPLAFMVDLTKTFLQILIAERERCTQILVDHRETNVNHKCYQMPSADDHEYHLELPLVPFCLQPPFVTT